MSIHPLRSFTTIIFLSFFLSCLVAAQSTPPSQKTQTKTGSPQSSPLKSEKAAEPDQQEPQEMDTLKTDTNLVSVPVIATDRNGTYVADLTRDEFAISEDGVKQEVAFFGTITTPFHVVLLLDTSASTEQKLTQIKAAASAFVDQLQSADRVKVISFDDQVRDLNDFTNDRAAVKSAIAKLKSGQGTKVYDAIETALNTVRRIQGRKAFVVFTDGVDWHSDRATFDGTIRWLDEEGVIVYPIRYETRAETERLAREQSQEMSPELPTLAGIHKPPSGTTAPTFPSDDPDTVPVTGTQPKTGPFGLPLPDEILRRRRQGDPNPDRRPSDDITLPPQPTTLPPPGSTRSDRRGSAGDSISSMLDLAYATADSYLKALAEKSGGTLLRADSLASLPDAFSKIAAELRTQYLLGYYPMNKTRDEHYRRIKVTSTRKNVVIRSRPGYVSTVAR